MMIDYLLIFGDCHPRKWDIKVPRDKIIFMRNLHFKNISISSLPPFTSQFSSIATRNIKLSLHKPFEAENRGVNGLT